MNLKWCKMSPLVWDLLQSLRGEKIVCQQIQCVIKRLYFPPYFFYPCNLAAFICSDCSMCWTGGRGTSKLNVSLYLGVACHTRLNVCLWPCTKIWNCSRMLWRKDHRCQIWMCSFTLRIKMTVFLLFCKIRNLGNLHVVFNDIIIWGRCSQDAALRSLIIKKHAMQYSYNLFLHPVLQVVSLRILERKLLKIHFPVSSWHLPPLSWATFSDSSSLFQAGSSQ